MSFIVLNDTAPTKIYPLPLHGAVPISPSAGNPRPRLFRIPQDRGIVVSYGVPNDGAEAVRRRLQGRRRLVPLGVNLVKTRPEEHTSELQSRQYLVCRLLLDKQRALLRP